MTLDEAKLEFKNRRYRWAKSVTAVELENDFPHFKTFKGGTTWKFINFARNLDPRRRAMFVNARLMGPPLGGIRLPGEQAILDEYRLINLRPTELENELAARRKLGETVKFASKGKLQSAVLAAFQREFSGDGLEVFQLPGYTVPFLQMKCCGWMVYTNFNFSGPRFSGSRSLISYGHTITSEDKIYHPTTPGITGPAIIFQVMLCWIDLCTIKWEYLQTPDIEPACEAIVTMCREFFNELPKLLTGLERERISLDLDSPSPSSPKVD